ncbi:(d)CMP kinase [Turicimonas muris]|uniref:Cytidylate kinase n=2 Tax=Turicimonas muris TaxID=1796652 RepID=A0A227KRB8_9BURK|nr:(d)CMP kinase [Turicimonas muris]ANU65239.1 cytidylate kinase [Burkholderiales bacterium YL45]MBS4769279.1 (d)CMP kinase [Burkholderiales bacterium]OXE51043.1 cytidylate kinase [Turicimonas muris]QQQ96393.1 (d)CMP kinase [Turicimonas muris]
MEQNIPIITIDGPVASGKGSVSAGVAKVLGFNVLDSGSLYRLTAYAALQQQKPLEDEEQIKQTAVNLKAVFKGGKILLEGEDVTDAIRQEEVGLAASKVAVHPKVRKALFKLQREYAQAPGLVADGRDMGSVVFPEATLKIFLTASAEARAKRRYNQLKEKGIHSNIADLVKDLKERDERDLKRSVAPLVPAPGAKILDSSDLTLEETINQVLEWYRGTEA